MASNNIEFIPSKFNCTYETLVRNCLASIRPVHSKGEGLHPTIVDAMVWNGSVIASDIPQNREAMGNFGYWFTAGDEMELEMILRSSIENFNNLMEMRDSVKSQAMKKYSWETISRDLGDVYSELTR